MAIITAAGLSSLDIPRPVFNKNGSVVTLKKISETEWLLFGDVAEGDSQGFDGSSNTLNILEYMYFQPTSESDPIDYNEFTSRGGSVFVDISYRNQLDTLNFDEQITVQFPEEDYLWVGVSLPTNFSGGRLIGSGARELEHLQQITLNRDYDFSFDSQSAGSGFSEHVLPIGQQSVEMVSIGYFYSIDSPQNLLYKKTDGTSFQHSLNESLRFRLSVSEFAAVT